jgi:uncharacterized protein
MQSDEQRAPRPSHGGEPRLRPSIGKINRGLPSQRCGERPSPEVALGFAQFDRGEFFEQHETLEDAWIAETDPIRYLYQGILQVGVGLYHLERGNLQGARGMMGKGIVQLEPFRPRCLGVDIERFVAQARRCLQSVETLTDETLATFDRSLMPRVEFDG